MNVLLEKGLARGVGLQLRLKRPQGQTSLDETQYRFKFVHVVSLPNVGTGPTQRAARG